MKAFTKNYFSAIYNKIGIFVIFVVILIVASFASDVFFTTENLTNVLKQITVISILALGATFVIILGHINVSYGSAIALIGCAACQVMLITRNVFISILTALLMGVFIGAVNGYVITTFKIPAFIMTLATTTICRGAALLITGGLPVTGMDKSFLVIGQGTVLKFVPISVLILLVVTLICWVLLRKTRFGRHVYAVGGNENAAIASGIRSDRVVMKAFILDGVLTAIAAVVFVSRMNSGQPAAGIGYEFQSITAVVVGGTSLAGGIGNIFGTIIGALIVGIINNVQTLIGIHTYWQQIVQGAIILIAVIADVLTKKAGSSKK